MILEVSILTMLYKNGRGISDINFTMDSGEIFGLLGPNGSGKTTTMKACIGLVQHTSGTVRINDHDVTAQREKALMETGALIEAPALYDNLSARKNLERAAMFYPSLEAGRVSEVLKIVDMQRYENDKVGTFSLGMRQRIGIALAIINKPKLLILDEPANGLDIEGMVAIREMVKSAAAEGSAVLISSHLAHEIELVATRVAIMHQGLMLSNVTLSSAMEVSPSLEDFFLSEVTRYRKEGIS